MTDSRPRMTDNTPRITDAQIDEILESMQHMHVADLIGIAQASARLANALLVPDQKSPQVQAMREACGKFIELYDESLKMPL